jgi:hypothetical protein
MALGLYVTLALGTWGLGLEINFTEKCDKNVQNDRLPILWLRESRPFPQARTI